MFKRYQVTIFYEKRILRRTLIGTEYCTRSDILDKHASGGSPVMKGQRHKQEYILWKRSLVCQRRKSEGGDEGPRECGGRTKKAARDEERFNARGTRRIRRLFIRQKKKGKSAQKGVQKYSGVERTFPLSRTVFVSPSTTTSRFPSFLVCNN